MFKHVVALSVLFMIQGVIDVFVGGAALLYGLIYGGLGAAFMFGELPDSDGRPVPDPEVFAGIMGGVGIVFAFVGLIILGSGIAKIVAGAFNMRFKRRTLGFVALGAALASLVNCYCAPLTGGLIVYGLVVLLDAKTKRAFELGEQGFSSDEIYRTILNEQPESTPRTRA